MGMRPEDVYSIASAGDPRLSPDGRLIAYVVTRIDEEANTYRSAIWVVPVDGSEEPRRFTAGDRRDGSPRGDRWDVDLQEALYELELDTDGAEPKRLSAEDESTGRPAYSADGSLIAYYHAPDDGTWPRHSQLAVIPAGGGERRILTASL